MLLTPGTVLRHLPLQQCNFDFSLHFVSMFAVADAVALAISQELQMETGVAMFFSDYALEAARPASALKSRLDRIPQAVCT